MSETMIDSDSLFKAPFEILFESSKIILKKSNGEVFSLNKDLGYNCLDKESTEGILNAGVKAYTIVGVAETKTSKYLVAATKTKFVGKILTSNVFKIEEVRNILLIHILKIIFLC